MDLQLFMHVSPPFSEAAYGSRNQSPFYRTNTRKLEVSNGHPWINS